MTALERYHHKRRLEPSPSRDDAMPSLNVRLGNAAKAAGRIVAAVAKGEAIIVSAPETERRLAICKACDWWQPEAYGGIGGCGHGQCGCSVVKLRFQTEQCPTRKW